MHQLQQAIAGQVSFHKTISCLSPTEPLSLFRTNSIDSKLPIDHKQHATEQTISRSSDFKFLRSGEYFDPLICSYVDIKDTWHPISPLNTVLENHKWNIVLELDESIKNAKGLIVRVGHYCQGVLKIGDAVTVERWRFIHKQSKHTTQNLSTKSASPAATEKSEPEPAFEGDWTRELRLGDHFLPCAIAFRTAGLQEGAVVNYGDFCWRVEEVCCW